MCCPLMRCPATITHRNHFGLVVEDLGQTTLSQAIRTLAKLANMALTPKMLGVLKLTTTFRHIRLCMSGDVLPRPFYATYRPLDMEYPLLTGL